MQVGSVNSTYSTEFTASMAGTDEQFLKEFRARSYVFSKVHHQRLITGLCCGNKLWVQEGFGKNSFEFYLGDNHLGDIYKSKTGWCANFGGQRLQFTLFADALQHTLTTLVQGQPEFLTYSPVPGIIWKKPHLFDEEKFLESFPKGTFFVEANYDQNARAYIKGGNEHNLTLCPQVKALSRDAAVIKQWVFESVRPNELVEFNNFCTLNLEEDLTLCSTLLDLTALFHLDADCRKKVIAGFSAAQFEDIEHVLLAANRDSDCRDPIESFQDIIYCLAKNGVNNARIYFSNYIWQHYTPHSKYQTEVKKVLEEFGATLKGKELEWALDRYYEVLFYNTSKEKERTFQIPHVEPRKQMFYDNQRFGTDLAVQFRDSEASVHVHKVTLAMFSEKLKTMMFHGYQEAANQSFCFDDFSDAEVNQLLRVIYGFEADFEQCDIIELLKISDAILSEQFTDLVNDYLNKSLRNDKISLEKLVELMLSPYWKHLGQLAPFFQYVSTHWRELMEAMEEEDQKQVRESFFAMWHEFTGILQPQ